MGSRNGWAAELAKRCRAVGWTAEIAGSGHWRVKTHEGRVFSIACSSSDIHGKKNAERAAARHGLERLEEELALQRERERLERLEQDRAQGVNWEKEERKIKEQQNAEPVLGYVNGVAVLERVPARAVHPRAPEKVVDIKHGMELGLEDGTVIFECVHPVMRNHEYQDCGRQFEAANSLRTHISWHNRQGSGEGEKTAVIADDADAPEVIAEVKAKVDAEVAPQTGKSIADLKEGESTTVKMAIVVTEPKRGIIAELTHLGEHAQALIDELDRVGDELDTIRQGVSVLRADIAKATQRIATEHVDVDELRAKAARYDEIVKIAR